MEGDLFFGFAPRYEFEKIAYYSNEKTGAGIRPFQSINWNSKEISFTKEKKPEMLYSIDVSHAIEVFRHTGIFKVAGIEFYEYASETRLFGFFEELRSLDAKYYKRNIFIGNQELVVYYDEEHAKKVHDMLPELIEKNKARFFQTYKNRKRKEYEDAVEWEFQALRKNTEENDYDIEYNYGE